MVVLMVVASLRVPSLRTAHSESIPCDSLVCRPDCAIDAWNWAIELRGTDDPKASGSVCAGDDRAASCGMDDGCHSECA